MNWVWLIVFIAVAAVMLFGLYTATQNPLFWVKAVSAILSNFNLNIKRENKHTKKLKRVRDKWGR